MEIAGGIWRRRLADHLARRAAPLSSDDLAGPAVVFAPHQDDETLGCGAAILGMRDRGVPVTLVFMTDGAGSHPPSLVDRAVLAQERESEARSAAVALGVPAECVHFLGVPDGALARTRDAVGGQVEALLARERPAQVFTPYHRDTVPDHAWTYRIVSAALARNGVRATRLGYPVWFFDHWPWMRQPVGGVRSTGALLRGAARGLLAARAELRHYVPTGPLLARKRAALACHRSQMERRGGEARWLTLADVAGGDFLACLLAEREFFHVEAPPTPA